MEEKDNMICDIETGICGEGASGVTGFIDLTATDHKEVPKNDCDEPKQNA